MNKLKKIRIMKELICEEIAEATLKIETFQKLGDEESVANWGEQRLLLEKRLTNLCKKEKQIENE